MLALSNPAGDHFSLCIFKFLGMDFCPGCGIGHSIAWLFRLNIERSISCHPLGIPALILLLFRIFQLIKIAKNQFYEPKTTIAHTGN